MATLFELEQALINADRAGDTDAARKLAAVIARARQDPANKIPGNQVPGTYSQPPEPSLMDRVTGAAETVGTMATGATTGLVGLTGGFLKGLAEQALSGGIGTQEGARAVEESAVRGAQALTYQPRTQAGQEMVESVGEAVAQVLPPVLPMIGQAGQAGQVARNVQPLVAATAQRGVQAAQRVAAPATEAVRRGVESVRQSLPGQAPTETFGRGSVGAAQLPEVTRRVRTAEALPVPFEGKSGLTEGQASRNFSQLQFEKEIAKQGDLGAPLRERVQNQTATFVQNFDAMIDRLEPIATDKRSVGQAVDRAIVNRAEVMRRRVRQAYKEAEEAGAMAEPVEMQPLASRLTDLSRYEGVSPNIAAIKREAVRLGAVAPDEGGNLVPQRLSIGEAETLRQFVNESTDWMDRRQALFARRINESIDQATEGKGGELYQKARKLRQQQANEFENVGLTSKMLKTKRGTDERQIAFEDVFDKIIISSPVEEMNKLRATLLRSGRDGKQAWNDLKAQGLAYIKEASLSPSQADAAGNPLLSPDKLVRVVRRLDEDGKLVSLYGNRQAQQLRDLAELSTVIYTAPPGSINTSNTASALQVALDTTMTFGITGVPAPVATALREASKYVKNRKVKARIEQALKPQAGNAK